MAKKIYYCLACCPTLQLFISNFSNYILLYTLICTNFLSYLLKNLCVFLQLELHNLDSHHPLKTPKIFVLAIKTIIFIMFCAKLYIVL